ncbi:MAG: hypothetical protein DI535_11170 [Citrobacter freundii]|nr:MAG: hypothetical protein DI535_11170 [Citrobacter freundii]
MNEPINAVAQDLGVSIASKSGEEQVNILVDAVNELLLHDFDRLVTILYRVDVDELKLKQLLKERAGEDAARIIVMLLIERQEQKIRTRREFSTPPEDPDDDERW